VATKRRAHNTQRKFVIRWAFEFVFEVVILYL